MVTIAHLVIYSPSANETVSVAYKVPSDSSVGRKPIVLEVWVDPDDTRTDSWLMPIDGIEKYNNDADHLPDPDGGTSLETSDLYHFPYGSLSSESYGQIIEAATAGMTQQLHMLQRKRS